ncbi:MAG: phenylalanine--tRNA ligase subunit beta [Firmicutes bacterium]|nr:phenylalanine--tRNA ligase subunit beta [Bacillota bacterium]
MIILESMLKKWISIPENILELTNQKIIEVDDFGPLNSSTNLVVGHVLTCVDHPNSDHLHVTTVDLGDRVEQIVCGATNVAAGQYVIVAQVGSVLPGDFKIKASNIRGESSNGMICSLKELDIDDKNAPIEFKEGIYHFDGPREIGSSGLNALSLDGWKMTLGLTPNRADLMSHLGFAYDVASMTGQKVSIPAIKIKESSKTNPISVDIKTDGCARYYARHFESLEVKESPWWLKSALIASDIKPINNIVDISNYVLIEYGTPLHMFDYNKIGSNQILVRYAKAKEKVVTLDEIERELSKEDVVITNGKEVIAVGGVMGLYNTMIDEKTTSVVLEAAYFDPKHILKTSKRLGLRSDSSIRFERGIDPERVYLGLERATELLVELANAKVSKGVATKIQYEIKNPAVKVNKNYFNESLGVDIPENDLLSYFDAYNYNYNFITTGDSYEITAPSYRRDLLIDADFLEEIARIYGLDLIPMKSIDKPLPGKLTFKQKRLRALRHHLANLGLNEVITYSLIAPSEVYRYNKMGESVSILMPLSEDKKTLRQSLVHGLLETINYNQSRQLDSVAVFEMGNCFAQDIEHMHLGLAMSGAWHKNPWKKESLTPDYYTVKGIVDSLFLPLDIELEYKETSKVEGYHPYRQASVFYKNLEIGILAELHPNEAKRLNIDATVIFEINLTPLLENPVQVRYTPTTKYPNITRDLAIVVDELVTASELISIIKQTVKKNLVQIDVFDVYQGTHIEKGKKSIAFNLVFNDSEKTLSAEDVDQLMKKITGRLSFTYKAVIRS